MKNFILFFAVVSAFSTSILASNATKPLIDHHPTNEWLAEEGPSSDRYSLLLQFANNNAEMISFLAHPTSTYLSSSTSISGNTAYITIRMKDNWMGDVNYLKVALSINRYDYIGNFRVISDGDFFPAFAVVDEIKKIIDDEVRGSGDKNATRAEQVVEEILNSTYYEWDGKDLVLFLLNLSWLDNGYYSAY